MAHDENHRVDVSDQQGDDADYPSQESVFSHDGALHLAVDRTIIIHGGRVVANQIIGVYVEPRNLQYSEYTAREECQSVELRVRSGTIVIEFEKLHDHRHNLHR